MTKLTIKEEMRAIDCRDMGWWDTLTDEEKKKLGIYVLMRWASATSSNVREINEHYLLMINDNVNMHFNIIRHHPQLQHRLMQAAGIGSSQRHDWIKPGKKTKKFKVNKDLHAFFLSQYPHLNDDEIGLLAKNTTVDELRALLDEHGYDKKDITKMLK